jgi:Uma2 family endonuclease
MLDVELPVANQKEEMPSLNHSYLCSKILRQLFGNPAIEALTELTLDVDNGLTPDICIYPAETIHPNFLRDVMKMQRMPTVAIEVISASQNIQGILEKAERLVKAGVKVVWTVEPYTRTVFVTTEAGESIFHNQPVESEGIKVDFKQIFETTQSHL